MAKLSAFAPESAVSASFPGTCSDKLQLLNGWLSPAGQRSRQAYRRARWYLRRRRDQTRISLEVCSALGGPFTLLVNGEALSYSLIASRRMEVFQLIFQERHLMRHSSWKYGSSERLGNFRRASPRCAGAGLANQE